MRLKHHHIIAAAAILLGCSSLTVVRPSAAADDVQMHLANFADEEAPATVEEPAAVDESADYDLAETYDEFVEPNAPYGAPYLGYEEVAYSPQLAVRFGWWGLDVDGSRAGVGEWMGLENSSPFYDVDGLTSDGYRTLDFYITGPESEANQAYGHFYAGPGLSVDVDYDRYLHRLGHAPYQGPADAAGFPPPGGFYGPDPLPAGQPGAGMWGQDLNVGQDYAIRVQQLKANFQGRLTDSLSWRLNVWGIKKEGMRQTNAMTHCFDARRGGDAVSGTPDDHPAASSGTCHLVSQGQNIDWLTMEIEPVISARFGWLTLEYSRTMRSFQQNDDLATFRHTRGPSLGLADFAATGIEPAYAYASENITEIDRLKVLGQVAPDTDLYVHGFLGNTHNKFRASDRKFYGADARLTNTSLPSLTTTVYGKMNAQQNSEDGMALDDRYPGQNYWVEGDPPGTFISAASQGAFLVDRVYMAAGLKGRWRPFYDSCGWASRTAVVGGYEYRQIDRENVTYNLRGVSATETFTQPDTNTNMFFVGLQQDLSASLSAYARYRLIETDDPLVGVTRSAITPQATINSNLPEHEDRIELGGNWSPTDYFLLNASVWIQNSYNHWDGFVNFDEDNYPVVLSAVYTPDERWALSGGFATFSNWISQDITLSDNNPFTSEWNYAGRADVFNLGASYAWTCRTTLTGGVEYVRSRNVFDDPLDPNGVPYDPLAEYSAVRVNTLRLTAGTDYRLSDRMNTFVRYNYYDWDDETAAYNAGTAHMFLAGVSGVY